MVVANCWALTGSEAVDHFLVVARDKEQYILQASFARAMRTGRSSCELTCRKTRPRSVRERLAPGLADK